MFGLKKSPLKAAKHITVNPASSGSNPFENAPVGQNTSTNPFDDGQGEEKYSSYSYKTTLTERNKYKNDFRDTGGVENQSVEELENYAVYKAEETTKSVNGCLKIAEEIREDATKTLVTLHQQGEQITRSHMVAADIDQDLSRVWFPWSNRSYIHQEFRCIWKIRLESIIFPVLMQLVID